MKIRPFKLLLSQNPTSPEVILGKYIAGSSLSYDEVALSRGATYFAMPATDWSNAYARIGKEGMWQINKTFLDQQIAAGKTFIYTSDPKSYGIGTYSAQEYLYLKSKGYSFTNNGGLYYASKK